MFLFTGQGIISNCKSRCTSSNQCQHIFVNQRLQANKRTASACLYSIPGCGLHPAPCLRELQASMFYQNATQLPLLPKNWTNSPFTHPMSCSPSVRIRWFCRALRYLRFLYIQDSIINQQLMWHVLRPSYLEKAKLKKNDHNLDVSFIFSPKKKTFSHLPGLRFWESGIESPFGYVKSDKVPVTSWKENGAVNAVFNYRPGKRYYSAGCGYYRQHLHRMITKGLIWIVNIDWAGNCQSLDII